MVESSQKLRISVYRKKEIPMLLCSITSQTSRRHDNRQSCNAIDRCNSPCCQSKLIQVSHLTTLCPDRELILQAITPAEPPKCQA